MKRHHENSKANQGSTLLRGQAFQGAEGAMLSAGLGLGLAYVMALVASWFWWPDEANALVAVTGTNILFGRAAGLSFGFAAGLDAVLVVGVNMLIETVLVLLFYALFVLSWNHLVEIKALARLMDRTRRAAEANRDKIRRFGMIGLFVFVWIPFWMTGPIIGSVIGFFMGLRPAVNLSVVLGGTYAATVSWALVLKALHDQASKFNPYYGPLILVVFFVALALLARFIHGLRRKNQLTTSVSGSPRVSGHNDRPNVANETKEA